MGCRNMVSHGYFRGRWLDILPMCRMLECGLVAPMEVRTGDV